MNAPRVEDAILLATMGRRLGPLCIGHIQWIIKDRRYTAKLVVLVKLCGQHKFNNFFLGNTSLTISFWKLRNHSAM